MAEIHIPYLPSAKFFKILCRLGIHEQDVAGDDDSNPQIRTIGGTVTISTSVTRFRYTEADGRARVVYNKPETYNIQTATGELFDADGNLGVYLLDTTSPGVDPQGWTYRATVRPEGGEPFDVVIPSGWTGEAFDLGDGLVFTPSTGITSLENRVKALEDAPSSGGIDTEGVQDIVGAMVAGAGGTYDDGAGTITLPASDSLRKQHAAGVSNLASLVRKLDRGVSNAGILVISDSTGNQTNEWAYLVAQWLAGRYPAYTVTVAFWDEVGETSYQAPTTIQTGTGTRTITVWIAAKAGGVPAYFLGARFDAAIRATSPDVVFLSHGHNMGDPTASESGRFGIRNNYLACTEPVAKTHPFAAIVLIAQNPTIMTGRENWQAEKANILWELAGNRDYGVIDVHEAFIQTPNWGTVLLNADGVHPSDAGSQVWADTVTAALEDARGAIPARITPTPLALSARNYIKNHDFSAWTGVAPDNWTVNANATVEKDTTNYESGTQAAKVVGAATTGAAYIEAAVTGGDARELRGEWITVAVRVREPASNTQTVRVQVLDSTGTANQRLADTSQTAVDGYQWLFANKRIDAGATGVYVRLSCRTTGAELVDATFDRVYLVKGLLPFAG